MSRISLTSFIVSTDGKSPFSFSVVVLTFLEFSFHSLIICESTNSGKLSASDVFEKPFIISFYAFSKLLFKPFLAFLIMILYATY